MIERHYKAAQKQEESEDAITSADLALIDEWCFYAKLNPAQLSDAQKRSILFSVKNNTSTPFTNSVLLDLKMKGITIKF